MGSVRDKMVEQIRAAKRSSTVAEPVVQVMELTTLKMDWVEEPPIVEVVVEEVRARDENGHFVADDPATPENEAWTKKPKAKKKAAPKKKTTAKKSKQIQ